MEPQSSHVSSTLNWELHFLIAKFLEAGPFQEASRVLIREVERHKIIPKRTDWLGQSTSQDFRSFSSKYEHIKPDHLARLLQTLLDKKKTDETQGSIVPAKNLLSSLLKVNTIKRNRTFAHPLRHTSSIPTPYKANALVEREVFGVPFTHRVNDASFFSRLKLRCSSLGHLTAVYCVLFDVTGNFIFTGADDHLVKIWSAVDGRLLASLRGNSAEITDLAVNKENTLLASSSCDRYIRIWCLASGAPVTTLVGHSSNVTSIFFCPVPRSRSRVRYLASTSTDGSVAFWAYTDEPGETTKFEPKPTTYLERMRPGHAQMICSSFSPGGTFMAAGSADNNVRVYHMMEADGPKRVLEVEPHTERVDSISWAHRGLRFISGSKDGTALVWRYDFGDNWRFTKIQSWKQPPGEPVIAIDPKLRPRVTMIGWNADDTLVLTAVSNHQVKVWNPDNGLLVRILKDHTDEVYVIEPHPIYPRVVCTAGHDGQIFVWDIGLLSDPDIKGVRKVFEYKNVLEEGQGHGAVFDVKWSPDGLSLAATDSHGHVLMVGCAGSEKFQKLPKELFFHTDYRPLTTDGITNTVLDEQTQVLPHLMPPPFLVNMDGAPYPAPLQRLVPGRENCKEEQLIPNVAVAPGGQPEVIEGIPAPNGNNVRSIDEMIAQLVAEQGQAQPQERRESIPAERRGIGNRRSGDIEGVRQSRGNWQTVGLGGGQRRIVPPLSAALLARSEEIRHALGEEEENYYNERKNKKVHQPSNTQPLISAADSISSQEIKSRRLRRLAAQAAERRRLEEVERMNEEEGIPRPNPPQQEISVPQIMPRRRSSGRGVNLGSRRTTHRRSTVGSVIPPRRRRPRFTVPRESDGEVEVNGRSSSQDSSFSSSDISGTSSSESEFTDSDWGGGGAGASPSKPSASSPRKVPPPESRKRKRGANSGSSKENENGTDNSDEDYEGPKPGPSSQAKAIKQEPKPRPNRQKRKVVDETPLLDGISPQFRPSEWFGSQKPCRFPYWPQIGDDLIYFWQGHERYIKTIQAEKVYTLPKKAMKSLPWNQNPKLEPQIHCRVISVKFEINPPRLVSLKLGIVDPTTGDLTGSNISVTYHDMRDVVDFLILKQLYDKSMRHNWSENDRFRCLISSVWWLGSILRVEPYSPKQPSSKFLLYKVKWDNGDRETLSPWDIEVIPDAFEIPDDSKDNGIPATDEDVRAGLYEVTSRDWPPYGHQEAECDRISMAIGEVMELSVAEVFLTPVDLNTYPEYCYSVAYPMDLSTIKSRLDNRFYRRVEALKFDIKYIAINTETFNVSRSEIVKKSRIVKDLCLRICGNAEIDVNAEYHSILRHFAWASTDIDEEERRRKGRQKREEIKMEPEPEPSTSARYNTRLNEKNTSKTKRRRGPAEGESNRPWEDRCRDLLNNLWECRDSAPFREPVDPTEYPDYYQQIDTPMDLQSIKEDLLGGNYDSPVKFSKDLQLIFSNSKQYNTDKHSQIYIMTLRLKGVFDCAIRPILEDWKRNKNRYGKGGKSGRNMARTPTKRQTDAEPSTPRKNPIRSAARKNRSVKVEQREDSATEDEVAAQQDSSSEEEFVADEENYRDRRKRRRRKSHKDSPPPTLQPQPSTSRGTRNGMAHVPPVIKEEVHSTEDEEEPDANTSSEEEEEEQVVVKRNLRSRPRGKLRRASDSEDQQPAPSVSKVKIDRKPTRESILRRTSSRRTSAASLQNGSCHSSVPSSPRKNPKRSAARKNPYINHENSTADEAEASSEDEFIPPALDNEEFRAAKRRRSSINSSVVSLESRSSTLSPKRNRGRRGARSSSPEPIKRRSTRIRPKKRARICSDDDEDDEDRPQTRFRGRSSKKYEEVGSSEETEDQ